MNIPHRPNLTKLAEYILVILTWELSKPEPVALTPAQVAAGLDVPLEQAIFAFRELSAAGFIETVAPEEDGE